MPREKNFLPKKIRKALKQTSQIERKIACLYYYENLAVNDIAIILHKDEQYVQKMLGKILANLTIQISGANSFTNKKVESSTNRS